MLPTMNNQPAPVLEADVIAPTPELRCQYPSKRCDYVRTTKRGGGLHRLCAFHRARANKNQWLVDQRRRLRRELEGTMPRRKASSPSAYVLPVSAQVPYQVPARYSSLSMLELDDASDSNPSTQLEDIDLAILQSLLFDDDSSDDQQHDASAEWFC
ncbi:hypothetical protein P43SY_008702 [Pythium insidiosum]|uniref:Uncharacterized protein n=1 Tax=Pythium insidiosum TaxID=114742 RepID=A0AAD5QC93_PYTIN|nr:hypothetical protein P43SY_008702 [Pythium insidiosum]